jgi:hypothetical protein
MEFDFIHHVNNCSESLRLDGVKHALQGDGPGRVKNRLYARTWHQGGHSLDERSIDNLNPPNQFVHLF